MIKRFALLAVLIILMTGCSINYTIEIKDNKIIETIDGYETDIARAGLGDPSFQEIVNIYSGDKELLTSYELLTSDDSCTTNCKYYDKNTIINSNEVSLLFNATHTFDEYSDSTIPNNYISGFKTEKNGDLLTISSSGNWSLLESYPTLDDIVIKVKTDYEVESTNATKDADGNYVWKVNKNTGNKKIYITVNTAYKIGEREENNKKVMITIALVVSLILLVLLFIGYSLNQKRKNNNRL